MVPSGSRSSLTSGGWTMTPGSTTRRVTVPAMRQTHVPWTLLNMSSLTGTYGGTAGSPTSMSTSGCGPGARLPVEVEQALPLLSTVGAPTTPADGAASRSWPPSLRSVPLSTR